MCRLIIIIFILGWAVTATGSSPKDLFMATFYYARSGSITADGSKVHPGKVKNKEHRWIAVSRDLKRSKEFSFGDTVIIESTQCPGLNGKWIVKDLMGPRHSKRVDFLLHREEIDELKFWMPHKVKVRKHGKEIN